MNKARKIFALLIALTMIFALVACAEADPSKGRVQLIFSLWGDPAELDDTQEALDVFNNSQDKIWVTAIQIANEEYAERLLTMAAGGNMPDCGMVDERTAIGWTREGLLMKIDIYEGQPSKPKDGLRFSDGGETVAYSVASEALALWFNKALFDEAGIDYPPATLANAWTWDEFIEVAKKLTFDANGNNPDDPGFDKDNIVQYGAYVNQWAWQLEVWALSNNGRWYSEDGTRAVFDAAAIEAMQMVFDLHLVHHVAPFNDAQTDNGFWDSVGRGNVAMGTDGQWAAGFVPDAQDAGIDYGIGVLPYMKRHANITAGGPIGVFATTEHPEEAAEFLRWYADPDNNFGAIEAGWWMPNMANWFTDSALLQKWIFDNPNRQAIGADSYKTAMADVAVNGAVTVPTGWYYTPNTDQIDRILIPALVEAINGSKTAAEVIEGVRGQLEAAIAG